MFRPETGGGENGADVGEGAFGLCGGAFRDVARGGIDRKLSGDEDERAGVDSLRVGTDRGGGGGGATTTVWFGTCVTVGPLFSLGDRKVKVLASTSVM